MSYDEKVEAIIEILEILADLDKEQLAEFMKLVSGKRWTNRGGSGGEGISRQMR
jgi:hypothetical protein